MALELFDPFIIRELQRRGYCNTIKSAKKMIEREEAVVYDILEDITKDHPVLLNRAPTLHRLGVQAFMPKLIEGKAIQLHPLTCSAFNADFDGDQMPVHVPLSTEAVLEAKMIILAENNILKLSSGLPVAGPWQDVALGCFYLTRIVPNRKGEGMRFSNVEEAIQAHSHGVIDLQAAIKVRVDGRTIECSVGRLLFDQALPEGVSYFDEKYSFANETIKKGTLNKIVTYIHRTQGPKKTADVLDRIKDLGFEYAKRSGISIGIDDMKVPVTKTKIIGEAQRRVNQVQQQYQRGHLTDEERYHKNH